MNNSLQKLIKKGFKPIKQTDEFTVLKANNGLAVCYNNNKIELFIKNEQNIPINEINLRHIVESIVIVGLGMTYLTTDITIVDGDCMLPTYKNKTILIRSISAKDVENILISRHANIKFKTPKGETMFKRVIGMPGDEITFQGYNVYVNGKLVDDGNSHHIIAMKKLNPNGKSGENSIYDRIVKYKLKDTEYFVMGDNRDVSIDSREYGPIDKSCIISVVDR